MTPEDLYRTLVARGAVLSEEGDQLKVRAPNGALDESLRQSLRDQRDGLLVVLRRKRLSEGLGLAEVRPVERGETAPVSYAQRGLWLIDQLESGGPTYNLMFSVRLPGKFDDSALTRALQKVVTDHEALRTSFEESSWGPVQRVHSALACVSWSLKHLHSSPGQSALDKARAWAKDEIETPFDLKTAPLARYFVLRLDETEHVLSIVIHHICCDAWSLGLLLDAIADAYEAYRDGRTPARKAPELQQADFGVWQQQWLTTEVLEDQRGYWSKQLAGAPPCLELPTDRPRPLVQSHHGGVVRFEIDSQLTEALRRLAQEQETTLYTVLTASMGVVLARLAGQEDLVLGTPISNRRQSALEDVIGFFVNTLALRLRPEANASFETYLAEVRRTVLGAFQNQDLPIEQVVRDVNPERTRSHTPLFQVMFGLLPRTKEASALSASGYAPVELTGVTAKFDLNFTLRERDAGIEASVEYARALFDVPSVEEIVGHFVSVLRRVVEAPKCALGALLTPAATDPTTRSIVEPADMEAAPRLLEELRARRSADAGSVAITCGDRSLTYGELERASAACAGRLQAAGLRPGGAVVVWAPRTVETFVGILAILRAGGAVVPLDPSYPEARLRAMVGASGATLCLTPNAGEAREVVGSLPIVEVAADDVQSEPVALDAARPNDPAYVLFTSGSSGVPKGVIMPHRALDNLVDWQCRESTFGKGRTTLHFAATSFDVSFQELLTTWASGGTLVVAENAERRDPMALLALIRRRSVERLFLPFVAFEQLAQLAADAKELPRSLREIYVAGEQLKITPQVVRLFERLEHCRLHNQYGPTETHVVTSYALPQNPAEWTALPSIGTPIARTDVLVCDEQRRPVPRGVPGELVVRGPAVALGYTQGTDSSERFGSQDGVPTYRTGDRVRYRFDGALEFLGRSDDQIKLRGFRVEPGEVEVALASLPEVSQCAVAARHDASGRPKLVAYVVPKQGASASEAALKTALSERLPEYMVPASWVTLSELPLTPSGKVDKRNLPEPTSTQEVAESAASGSETERFVGGLWMEFLELDDVGLEDDFFDLGGHSLLASQIALRVKERFGVEVPLRTFFDAPTVRAVSSLVDGLRWAGRAPSENEGVAMEVGEL